MVALPERHKAHITNGIKYSQARRYRMLHARLQAFFRQQSARVVARYLGTTHPTLEIPPWHGRLWGLPERKETQPNELLPDDEARRLQIVMQPELLAQYHQSAEIAAQLLGSETFDPDNPRVRAYLLAAGERIDDVTGVTRQAIQDVLTVGGERGYNQYQIARGVPEEDFPGLDDVVAQTYRNRSEAIVRTELAFASSRATLDQYDESDVTRVEARDGDGCGWVEHDDPDYPDGVNGLEFDLEDAIDVPIAHPNCVRVFLPVFR